MLNHQLVRFLVVGAGNTAFSYLMYALLLWIGLPYPIANFGAMLSGIAVSFYMQGRFVFDNTDPKRLAPFILVWLLIYAFNLGMIKVFLLVGFNAYLAGLFAIPFVVAAAFLLQKTVVFGKRQG